MRQLSITFIICAIFTLQAVAADKYSFRKTTWGMTQQQVLKAETLEPVSQNASTLIFKDELAGLKTIVTYQFINDQLVTAIYKIDKETMSNHKYIGDFYALRKLLVKKYGPPPLDDLFWNDTTYIDQKDEYGTAVAVGHLIYISRWQTSDTNVHLSLMGDNHEITLDIKYQSLKHLPLIRKHKEKKALGKL